MDSLSSLSNRLAEIGLTTGTLIVAASVLLVMYNWSVWDRHLYPPGPLPLPFVGHCLWLFTTRRNTFKAFYGLREKYGDVITMDLLRGTKLVVLNSPEAYWEGFINNAEHLTEREIVPEFYTSLRLAGGGLSEPEGHWTITRKHMQAVFREHGIGSRGIEPLILSEAIHLHEAVENTNCEPFDIHDLLTQATCNVITTVTMGRRHDYSDESLSNMQIADFMGLSFQEMFLPFIKYVPLDLFGYRHAREKARKGVQFVKEQIKIHKEDIVYENDPRDYTDAYLIKMREHENTPHTVFHEPNLEADVVGTYLAGTDTTSESLYWAILYMVLYPEVQERIYTEIKKEIGEKSPSHADRHLLPYTTAVVTELLRVSPVSAGSPFYKSKQDLTIKGHKIPAGTYITGNAWSVTHNEQIYPQPDQFKPERFLDDDGQYIMPEKKRAPFFGLGKRSCLGEHLARSEHFIFLTTTVQKFRLELGQSEIPSLEATTKLVLSVKNNYLIKATPRH